MIHLFKHSNGSTFSYIKEIKAVDNIVIARFKGAIDSSTIPLIERNIQEGSLEGYLDKNVLLDFKDVTHVDSATMAGLLIVLNQHQAHHTRLGIINIPELFKSYLQIDRLELVMRVYPDEETALADLA